MQDQQRVWGFFAHASIIVGMMFVVFFVIDRFNPAMEFLTSNLSKWLILVLALCAMISGLYSAIFLFQKQKRRDEKRLNPQTRPAHQQEHYPQQHDARQAFDSRAYPPQRRQQGVNLPERGYPANQPHPVNGQPRDQYGYPVRQSGNAYEHRDTQYRQPRW